jgi:hypothetical protein
VAAVWACVLVGLTAIVTIVKYQNKFRSYELAFGYVSDGERGA